MQFFYATVGINTKCQNNASIYNNIMSIKNIVCQLMAIKC